MGTSLTNILRFHTLASVSVLVTDTTKLSSLLVTDFVTDVRITLSRGTNMWGIVLHAELFARVGALALVGIYTNTTNGTVVCAMLEAFFRIAGHDGRACVIGNDDVHIPFLDF